MYSHVIIPSRPGRLMKRGGEGRGREGGQADNSKLFGMVPSSVMIRNTGPRRVVCGGVKKKEGTPG